MMTFATHICLPYFLLAFVCLVIEDMGQVSREQLGSRSAHAAVRQLLPSIFEQLFGRSCSEKTVRE
jgi:hypothetical protein